jgi:heme/copper-type cytochrome/quinol oxidase subunit 4
MPKMPTSNVVRELGFWCGLAAATATIAYDVVQLLQVAGVLSFPLDEILIYGTSLCIVVPFLLEMLAFHHLTSREKKFWTHAALLFTVIYAVFVTPNYVVQLAIVIPQTLGGTSETIRILEQTPQSLFWNYDAIGYISMGLATLIAIPALNKRGFERWVRMSFLAHALTTPLITVVYFYPTYSETLLFLGFPWAITAPVFMTLMAVNLRRKRDIESDDS